MTSSTDILLNGADGRDLPAGRQAALDRFRAQGLPTRRQEAWTFTSLNPLEAFLTAERPADRDTLAEVSLPAPLNPAAVRIVVRDGVVESDLSALALTGVTLTRGCPARLDDTSDERNSDEGTGRAVRDLAHAMADDGLTIHVAKNVAAGAIELVFIGSGTRPAGHHFALSVELETGASLDLAEHHLGAGGYAALLAGTIRVGDNARLGHVKLQDEGRDAFHLADQAASVGRDGSYRRLVLSTGSRLARDEVHVALNGSGADVVLAGAYAGSGRQHLDHTTHIDHVVPRTTSREIYKGVLDGRARGVFQGGIRVMRDAQQTRGDQLNKALLLSPRAEVNQKPALQIFADDVQCSHGATAGEIDEDALFYLRARGVDAASAKAMLVQAFLDEIFDELADADLAETLVRRVHRALEEGSGDDA